MAYVGNQPARGQWRKLTDISASFNGVLTTFTTSVPPGTSEYYVTAGTATQLLISLGGVIQQPDTDYTVSTNSITFTTPPTAGLSFFGVLCGDALNIGTPTDASVTTAKLAGGLSVGLTAGSASTAALYFTGDSNTGVYSPGADQVAISTGGTGRLFVDASGRIGVGTSSPTLQFEITNGTNIGYLHPGIGTGLSVGTKNASSLTLDTNNTSRVTITSAGLVGIGTTSPAQALDVNGNIQISGSIPRLLANMSGTQSSRFAIQNSTTNGNTRFFLYPNGTGNIAAINGINNSDPNASDYQAFDLAVIGTTDVRLSSSKTGSGSFLPITFYTSDTERARIDSAGRLLVGTSTDLTNYSVQVANTSGNNLSLLSFSSNAADGVYFTLSHSKSGTVGTHTLVANGDLLGTIRFRGSDGTNYLNSAAITCEVDGTPGLNDMPGRLVFSTTADAASNPTTRLTIASNGDFRIANTGFVHPVTDNAVSLGLTGFRWSAVWAANGTIQTSDQRAKADITNATLGSDFIKALRPVSYKWIEGGKRDTGERDEDNNYIYESVSGTRTHWGFIAQEVKQAVDESGVDFGGWVLTDKEDPDSQQALRYDQFIAPLTKALQETMAELEALKAEVAALKAP